MFCKKVVLRNFAKFTGKHLCQSLFFNKVTDWRSAILLKKDTLAQVFSCQFCKISKNTFFHRTPQVAASELKKNKNLLVIFPQISIKNYIFRRSINNIHVKLFLRTNLIMFSINSRSIISDIQRLI